MISKNSKKKKINIIRLFELTFQKIRRVKIVIYSDKIYQ